MKKLLLIAAMVLVGFGTKAQIEITDVFTNDLVIIGELNAGKVLNALSTTSTNRMTEYSLYYRILGETEIIGILIDTENPLDDNIEFALGSDIKETEASIKLLHDFLAKSDLKTSATIKDVQGRILQATKYKKKVLRLHSIDAKGDIIVDDCVYLDKRLLNRAYQLLLNDAEEKIKRAKHRNQKKK